MREPTNASMAIHTIASRTSTAAIGAHCHRFESVQKRDITYPYAWRLHRFRLLSRHRNK